MKRVALALLLTLCAIVATAAYAEYDGSDAQRTTTDAILYGLSPASLQARTVAIVEGLSWPARRVGRTGSLTRSGAEIKVWLRVSGD